MTQESSHNASSTSPAAGLRVGDTLDKYTIVQQIGAGGMASVWKGHDPVLDRYVAIKEFSATAVQAHEQDMASRFRGEADLQKRLAKNSPHLVQVFDFIDENRGLFIVMEYVDGQSLEQLLSKSSEPVEQRQALGIVGATALALGVIHKHNVVHRDLKPSNILLPKDGGLKVSDFGIAAIVGDQEAMAVGSVRYMAPELFREQAIDGRADIYSLGMIAYEMLAGREKFNEAFKVVLRDQRNQALRWMKWHTNMRAKAQPLSQINPEIPPALSELVARMMEKEVGQRVASSEELLEAMRRLFAQGQQAGQPSQASAQVDAPAVPSSNPTAALPKRSKLPYILAVILFLQVIGIGGVFYYQHVKEQNARDNLRQQAEQNLTAAAKAYQAGDYDRAKDLYTTVFNHWANDSVFTPAAQAGILLAQAHIDLNAGRYNSALTKIEAAREFKVFKPQTLDSLRQEAQSRSAFEGETKAISDLLDKNELGSAATRLAQFKENTVEEKKTVDALNERLLALKSKARDEHTIADATEERKNKGLEAGITYLTAQLAMRPSQRVQEVLDQWKQDRQYESLLAQARQFESQGKLDQAINALTLAQKINQKPEYAKSINDLRVRALLLQAQKYEERKRTRQAADAYTQVLGLDKDNAQAKAALARIQTRDQRDSFLKAAQVALGRREYDQAIAQYQNALEISSDDQTQKDLAAARLSQKLEQAGEALDANQLDKAREYLDAALTLSPENEQAKNLQTRLSSRKEYLKYLQAGDALREQGKYSQAQYQYLNAQGVAKTAEIQRRINDTEVQQLLAQARYYVQKEQWRSARAMLKTLLDKRPNAEAAELLKNVVNPKLPPETDEEDHGNTKP